MPHYLLNTFREKKKWQYHALYFGRAWPVQIPFSSLLAWGFLHCWCCHHTILLAVMWFRFQVSSKQENDCRLTQGEDIVVDFYFLMCVWGGGRKIILEWRESQPSNPPTPTWPHPKREEKEGFKKNMSIFLLYRHIIRTHFPDLLFCDTKQSL